MQTYLSDPFRIHLPGTSSEHDFSSIRQKVPLKILLFKEVEQAASTGQIQFIPPARLVKLFVLDDRLSIREYLFSIPHNQEFESGMELSFSRKVLPLVKRSGNPRKTQLVSDANEPEPYELAPQRSFPRMRPEATSLSKSYSSYGVVDFTLLYATLAGHRVPYMRDTSAVIRNNQALRRGLEGLMPLLSNAVEMSSMTGQTM